MGVDKEGERIGGEVDVNHREIEELNLGGIYYDKKNKSVAWTRKESKR